MARLLASVISAAVYAAPAAASAAAARGAAAAAALRAAASALAEVASSSVGSSSHSSSVPPLALAGLPAAPMMHPVPWRDSRAADAAEEEAAAGEGGDIEAASRDWRGSIWLAVPKRKVRS